VPDLAIGTSVIRIHRGDITMLGRPVGAIVNATGEDLRPAGGVSSAIHEFGGPDIAVECLWIGKLGVGRAVATTAGQLLAEYVIHTVPPAWEGGGKDEDRRLAATYRACLQIADEKQLRSIAFPSLSGGLYGFPFDRAAAVAIGTAAAYLDLAADRWERMQAARVAQAQPTR
jgi:O-acetyl-ADP-ribose deacetylase (regulator of RNase III)